jgi:hypothetical protein
VDKNTDRDIAASHRSVMSLLIGSAGVSLETGIYDSLRKLATG